MATTCPGSVSTAGARSDRSRRGHVQREIGVRALDQLDLGLKTPTQIQIQAVLTWTLVLREQLAASGPHDAQLGRGMRRPDVGHDPLAPAPTYSAICAPSLPTVSEPAPG